jgi:hypothetical protein
MEISVQSNEIIEVLSKRLGEMVVELETTRLALKKSQEGILSLEKQIIHAAIDNSDSVEPYKHEIL